MVSDLLAAASGNAIKIKLITKFKGNFNVIFFFMGCNFPQINHKYGRNKINDRNLYMLYMFVYSIYCIYVYIISSELCLRNLPQTFCELFSFLFDFSLVIVAVVVVVLVLVVVVVVTLSADVVVVVMTVQLVVAS